MMGKEERKIAVAYEEGWSDAIENAVVIDPNKLEAYRNLRDAAYHLLQDVKRRYPNQKLMCPYMIALERTLEELKNN